MSFKGVKQLSLSLLLAVALIPLAGWSRGHLRELQAQSVQDDSRPPLYLPDQKYVRLATMGFDLFASDILWFNLMNYFGKQYQSTRDYRWLKNMCQLVTDLDGEAQHVFEFCGTMLAWEPKDADASTEILSRAIARHPDNWRFWYMRGFNEFYFHEDRNKAQSDLIEAAKRPDAPAFLASLAAKMMAASEDLPTAIQFLENALERTNDPSARTALMEKLKSAYMTRDIRFLEEAVKRYHAQENSLPSSFEDLVQRRIITSIPVEPFGGGYSLSLADGAIGTTSPSKIFELHPKTARTGAVKEEFLILPKRE